MMIIYVPLVVSSSNGSNQNLPGMSGRTDFWESISSGSLESPLLQLARDERRHIVEEGFSDPASRDIVASFAQPYDPSPSSSSSLSWLDNLDLQ